MIASGTFRTGQFRTYQTGNFKLILNYLIVFFMNNVLGKLIHLLTKNILTKDKLNERRISTFITLRLCTMLGRWKS